MPLYQVRAMYEYVTEVEAEDRADAQLAAQEIDPRDGECVFVEIVGVERIPSLRIIG